jgi:hypothetical protein
MAARKSSTELHDTANLAISDLHAGRAELPLLLRSVGSSTLPDAVLEKKIAFRASGMGSILFRTCQGSAELAALLSTESFARL